MPHAEARRRPERIGIPFRNVCVCGSATARQMPLRSAVRVSCDSEKKKKRGRRPVRPEDGKRFADTRCEEKERRMIRTTAPDALQGRRPPGHSSETEEAFRWCARQGEGLHPGRFFLRSALPCGTCRGRKASPGLRSTPPLSRPPQDSRRPTSPERSKRRASHNSAERYERRFAFFGYEGRGGKIEKGRIAEQ